MFKVKVEGKVEVKVNGNGSGKDNVRYTVRVIDSIVVRISACHADDPGSIPGRGV